MLPDTFHEVLNGPCFLLNLDRCEERWPTMKERIETAGFTPERISAVDGKKGGCKKQWNEFMGGREFKYTFDSDGQSGCGLTHVKLWDYMIVNNIPFASVFEDDVMFHKDWKELAPSYYHHTDKETDIVFYGSQGAGTPEDSMITKKAVFCTHAYLISLEGAKKLLSLVRNLTELYPIDCIIIHNMNKRGPFRWQCWNGTIHPDPARHTALEYRNDGLVYQDAEFESNIHCNAPPELKD